MTPEADLVLAYLQEHCVGRDRAVPLNTIAQSTVFRPGEEQRTARRRAERACEEIREAGLPLCSACGSDGPKGMYLATTYSEVRRYLSQLDSRLNAMFRHRKVVAKHAASLGIDVEQLCLNLT